MKQCKTCHSQKPFSDFYKLPQMADGLMGECKECAKNRAKRNYAILMADPIRSELERERQRKKEALRRKDGRATPQTTDQRREVTRKYRATHPLKYKAHNAVKSAIEKGVMKSLTCDRCGSTKTEAHHDDYSKPLDVIWLCSPHHAERHVELRRIARAQRRLAKPPASC